MEIIFIIVLGIAFFGISVFGSILALFASTIVVEYLVAAIILLLIIGGYFVSLPLYCKDNFTCPYATAAVIAIVYTALIVCAIIALAASVIVLQGIVAVGLLLNLIATVIFVVIQCAI